MGLQPKGAPRSQGSLLLLLLGLGQKNPISMISQSGLIHCMEMYIFWLKKDLTKEVRIEYTINARKNKKGMESVANLISILRL